MNWLGWFGIHIGERVMVLVVLSFTLTKYLIKVPFLFQFRQGSSFIVGVYEVHVSGEYSQYHT